MELGIDKFPGIIFWRNRAREVLSNLVVLKLFDKNLIPIGELVTPKELQSIPWNIIYAKAITVIGTDKNPIKATSGYMSKDLWTCGCSDKFIRSKLFPTCLKCSTELKTSEHRLKPISELLDWENFIIDATEYKLSRNDHRY